MKVFHILISMVMWLILLFIPCTCASFTCSIFLFYNHVHSSFFFFCFCQLLALDGVVLCVHCVSCSIISFLFFYGDVVYKLRKILDHKHFNTLFSKRIKHFLKKGYDSKILQHTACLIVDPFTVGNYAFLFHCMTTRNS